MKPIKVSLEAFEGPLDLLLHLIDKNQIDIYDIPIAKLTDQYMAYIQQMGVLDMEQMSGFLVMAATLLEIKSKMLLPPLPKEIEEEGDPRAELVKRLIEYKQFRSIVATLRMQAVVGARYLFKKPDKTVLAMMKAQVAPDLPALLVGVHLKDLHTLFLASMTRKELKVDTIRSGFSSIEKDNYSITDKMGYVLDLLVVQPIIYFADLLDAGAVKIEKVVTFLAVLELTKTKQIEILQTSLFGTITIVPFGQEMKVNTWV